MKTKRKSVIPRLIQECKKIAFPLIISSLITLLTVAAGLYAPDVLGNLTQKIYGGDGVEFSDEAKAKIEILEKQGYGNLPICVAKTQYSFSDDATLLGAPNGFNIHVRDVKVSSGAGFIVVYTGTVMTMPGLPKIPAAENIDVDDSEKIKGLF